MTEKDSLQSQKYLVRTKIVLLCLASFLALVGTVFMFMHARLYALDALGGELLVRNPEVGVMPLVGTLLLLAALCLTFFEETRPKLAVATLILPILAGGVIFPSCEVERLYDTTTALPRIGYWMAVCGGILGLCSSVITAVFLFKNKNHRKEEASESKQTDYVTRLKEAAEALTAIRDLFDRGILTDKEYEEEKAFVMHLYGIGKVARDGVSEGFLERKAIPEEEVIATEETITIISNGFDDFDF